MKRMALLVCIGFAPLADALGQGGYIGGALGTFDYDESDVVTFPLTDSTSAYQLLGGYQFNEHFAVEFGIARTGDLEESFVDNVPGFGDVTLDFAGTFDIYELKLVGLLPFDRFGLFGSAGYYSASLSGSVSAQGFGEIGFFDGHERGSLLTAGVQYDFALDLENLSIRGEYQRFDFGSDIDASGFSIGMLYRF